MTRADHDLQNEGLAMPLSAARAGHAPHRAEFHRLGHSVPIAIAAFNAIYFAGQLLRGVL